MWFFLALAVLPGPEAPESRSDQELAEAFRTTRDGRYLLALIRRYEGGLVARYRRYAHEEAEAQEVFNELFLLLYHKLLKPREVRQVRGLLFTIVQRHLIDLDRRWQVHQRWEEESKAQEQAQQRPWSRQGLEKRLEQKDFYDQAMARLTPMERSCLELYLQHYSHQEIAERLGIDRNQVRGALYRAIKKLREDPDLGAEGAAS
jgi:RNA polymerase sigma factor (sigma-70 family)